MHRLTSFLDNNTWACFVLIGLCIAIVGAIEVLP